MELAYQFKCVAFLQITVPDKTYIHLKYFFYYSHHSIIQLYYKTNILYKLVEKPVIQTALGEFLFPREVFKYNHNFQQLLKEHTDHGTLHNITKLVLAIAFHAYNHHILLEILKAPIPPHPAAPP